MFKYKTWVQSAVFVEFVASTFTSHHVILYTSSLTTRIITTSTSRIIDNMQLHFCCGAVEANNELMRSRVLTERQFLCCVPGK